MKSTPPSSGRSLASLAHLAATRRSLRIAYFGGSFSEDWQRCDQTLAGPYPHYVESTAPGATFTYAFTGTDIGLYWLIAPDSGEIECSLDGQPPETFSSWDFYARDFTRASFVTLAEDLPNVAHTITVRVLPTRPGESTGSTVRIGALLVQ